MEFDEARGTAHCAQVAAQLESILNAADHNNDRVQGRQHHPPRVCDRAVRGVRGRAAYLQVEGWTHGARG